MEIQGRKIKNKDGSELVTEDSVTTDSVDSSNSSCSSSCESRLTCNKSPSANQLVSPLRKASIALTSHVNEGKPHQSRHINDSKPKNQVSNSSEMEMMKERFAKLLLGEDMSGSGKGVCPALAISNAITNLSATVFGKVWKLEPLPQEKKAMWRREMECLLCASDYIVELTPSWQTLPNGTRLEVMASRPRSDLIINLPALRKLDHMLLEILDGFTTTEFWYVDQDVITPESDRSGSGWNSGIQRQDDKWWLPVPRVLPEGLSEGARKYLSCKRDCANQIHKAAISINSISLAEMEVPESYLETLPKTGRACLGDVIYRYITSDHFSAECLLDCLDLSSEHTALEMANRVEAATHVWRRRQHPKPPPHPNRSSAKSWRIMADTDKRESSLAERADSLLYSLKQRFPGLTQTTLDTSKIHCNKDVGKSILESYSRVLECLAFNIVARIEDVLYVDKISKQSEKSTPASQKKVAPFLFPPFQVPVSGTPYRSFTSTPKFSPASLISPAKGERTPFLVGKNNNKPPRRGPGVKRALTNYLGGESKVGCGNILEGLGSISSRIAEGAVSRLSMEGKENSSR